MQHLGGVQFGFKLPSSFCHFPLALLSDTELVAYVTWQGSPISDFIRAIVKRPSFHVMSTSKPPRARKPDTAPFFQASGRAGSNRMTPLRLCNSISAIAAV